MRVAPEAQGYLEPKVIADPYEFYRNARRSSPIVKIHHPELGQDIYLVLGYALIQEVGRDPVRFSSEHAHILFGGGSVNPEADAILATSPCEPTLLLTRDDPIHKHRRAVVAGAFLPKRIAERSQSFERIVDELIDGFVEQGECNFVDDFAVHFPTYVIADILQLPRSLYDRVTRWADAIILRVGKMATKEQEIEAAALVVQFHEFIQSTIDARRRKPGTDLLSSVMSAQVDGEPALTEPELMCFLQEILVAGNETTRNTLIGGMALLLRHPAELRLLQDDLSLCPNAVEEILRLETPASAMWRIATESTDLGGISIPKGAILSLRYDAANRDESIFKDGEAFNVRRANARSHLSFSHGVHHCLGMHLARKELNMAFPKLIARLQNPRIVAEKSDLTYKPNIMIRAMRGLHIAFDRGPRVYSAAA
jgi:cytochrome P450